MERAFLDAGHDLGGHGRESVRFGDHDGASRLAYGRADGFVVEGDQGADIDDFE
ncbi:hypothetical protein D3C72_2457520 [compost metagenome]